VVVAPSGRVWSGSDSMTDSCHPIDWHRRYAEPWTSTFGSSGVGHLTTTPANLDEVVSLVAEVVDQRAN
jgi:hypothetical protein